MPDPRPNERAHDQNTPPPIDRSTTLSSNLKSNRFDVISRTHGQRFQLPSAAAQTTMTAHVSLTAASLVAQPAAARR
jgi:hypothetical protein